MKLTVGTTPVMLPAKGHTTPMVQNLGPGTVYFDNASDVSIESGIAMPVGAVYEFPADLSAGGGFIWMVADQDDSDIRFIRVG